jgi:hypothetical protein
MRTCEYEVVIESVRGQELRRVVLTSTTGHPRKGDELEIEGRAFEVRRVIHCAEGQERRTRREYSFVRLHVQPRGRGVWWRRAGRERACDNPTHNARSVRRQP